MAAVSLDHFRRHSAPFDPATASALASCSMHRVAARSPTEDPDSPNPLALPASLAVPPPNHRDAPLQTAATPCQCSPYLGLIALPAQRACLASSPIRAAPRAP